MTKAIVPVEQVQNAIFLLRGQRVMLDGDLAAHVNIAIMRAFVRLREVLNSSKTLALKLKELENKISSHDESIRSLFEAIRELMAWPDPPGKQIGFHVRESRGKYGNRK